MTSSHHGPYVQGYTRATMGCTEGSEAARWSGTQKATRSPDWSLQLDSMKSESLVIANQNVAVNTFPGLVHTARHTMGDLWLDHLLKKKARCDRCSVHTDCLDEKENETGKTEG